MTDAQITILRALAGGRATARDAARLVAGGDADERRVRSMLDRMERNGLLAREYEYRDPTGLHRTTLYVLTSEGRRVLANADESAYREPNMGGSDDLDGV